MPAVLVTGSTATQNSPFLPRQWLKPSPIPIAATYRGMTRLSGPEYPIKHRYVRLAKGGQQSQY